MNHGKKATNKILRDLKARKYEWSISRLKGQESRATTEELANFRLRFRRFKVLEEIINQQGAWSFICLEVKQYVSKFHQCVKRVECQKQGAFELFRC